MKRPKDNIGLIKAPESRVFNLDCMEGMKEYPDKYFELAIVDPPYGVGFGDYERGSSGVAVKERYTATGKKEWDSSVPNTDYFEELFRVSKNQIIWGGNYFALPPHQHFIFWYKKNPVPNFSDGELAWSSLNRPADCFEYMYYGNINSEKDRIHPTQKPTALYRWLLKNYAKAGDKILDTHLGSGSSRIACYEAGYDFTGYELDADYFKASEERFQKYIAQPNMFREEQLSKQAEQIAIQL